MIKISVNANRSDIAGYISYYSCKEIAPILEIDEKGFMYFDENGTKIVYYGEKKEELKHKLLARRK